MLNKTTTKWQALDWPQIERVSFQDWPLLVTDLSDKTVDLPPLAYDNYTSETSVADSQIRLVYSGQTFLEKHIPAHLEAAGIIVVDWQEATVRFPELVKEYLYSVIPEKADRVLAYHREYFDGGVFIYIPDHYEEKVVIDCLILQDSRAAQTCNLRSVIVAGVHARLEYIERLQTIGEVANSAVIITEVVARAGSQIKYCAIDSLAAKTTAYIKRYARTENDAVVNWAIGAMNDGHTILDTDTYLDGKGSESQLAIVAIASQDQVQGIDAKVVNRGHYSIGNILQHGVILDRATLTFNGIGLIEKNAKHADAQQESRVMMLSDEARGDANPILLIEEFEVTAGHAASAGQLDEQQLYYLMSRGLPRQEAEFLVVRGFLGSVIQEMPSQLVRDQMVAIIDRKLASLM
ncbi:Fe-S cluster assembly protein SufD [Aerococcaceae bacterium DSM 109653]|uniref:Fe-S cluster assembly protein SufD n=1 Tax=Fundicoccus ignavus TaxID=2664442 RepID=A0A844BFL2_9LACT|nr:SufD family Fe-S cluster assembly protein [Fundicoccus ignavus]MRI80750.1 Fe-S cluster assembly protein SufD [Fundicoccus ignavus]